MSEAATLSIIIPAYRAEDHLGACLEGFRRQTVGREQFELLVVDDHSPDATASIAERLGATVLRHQENRGAAAARNTGAEAARGEVLLFVDSDVVPEPDLVSGTLALFGLGGGSASEPPARVATGRYRAEPANDTAFARYKALWTWFCWEESGARQGESSHVQGSLTAIRQDLFQALGGFDEGYQGGSVEDYEFSLRLREQGERIVFDDRLGGRHHFPDYRTCARNYWDRARMWSRLASRGQGFSSGQASLRSAASAAFALGSVAGHAIPVLGLPLALVSDLGYLATVAPFLRFVHRREGLRFTVYSAGVHWSLSALVGLAALSSPLGSGSRQERREQR
ncbi:MAG: glycosyltransferase family 2 protein [Myxococcota bacterium]|nr:glycosyltransferase family 2 protein [Myxococcota bacterium]